MEDICYNDIVQTFQKFILDKDGAVAPIRIQNTATY